MVPPPPSNCNYYPPPGYYYAWRGQQWHGSPFHHPPPPLPSHWGAGLPQPHFRPQQQQPVTIVVVHQHFHQHYDGGPTLPPSTYVPCRTMEIMSQPQKTVVKWKGL